jgi:hypothetical protein
MAVFPPSMTHEGNLSDEKKAEIDRLLDEAAKPRLYIRPTCDGAWLGYEGNIVTDSRKPYSPVSALGVYEQNQREGAVRVALTGEAKSRASAEWSRQLRIKVKQAEQKTAVKVLVDLQDEP